MEIAAYEELESFNCKDDKSTMGLLHCDSFYETFIHHYNLTQDTRTKESRERKEQIETIYKQALAGYEEYKKIKASK